MSKVFISYRRDDSQDATGRLHDRMELLLGPDVFFRDIDNIAAGDNYRSALSNALDECSVLLAIIGPSWISIADDGQTR